jgi:3-oxoacyl-[acyl-carrier-protein] synthase-1
MSGLLTQPLALTAMGAISAVGANAPQTCTSIRAGLAGFSEHPFFESLSHDPEWEPGEPLIAAPVPSLDPALGPLARLAELAIPTLIELGRQARLKRADLSASALLVSLPELDSVVQGWGLRDVFLGRLGSVTGFTAVRATKSNHSGHTGMFELINEAQQLLSSGECRHCFLLGVDSYLTPDRMALWDREWRLRSARHADGFLPGEAGSALLLERPDTARGRGAQALALIADLGIADEPIPLRSDKSSTGAGLCQALDAVIPTGGSANWVCCDLNGESYRAFEWGLARVRLHASLEAMRVLEHPAECVGDIGAATGGILISHVAYALGRPNPPAQEAVLWSSADSGKRAALRVTAASAY